MESARWIASRTSVAPFTLKERASVNNKTMKPITSIQIVSLCYSYTHNRFELVVPPSEIAPEGYKVLAVQIDRADAEKFISQMHRKYVWKRKTGRYPTCSIVKLELELFVRLKNYRRKLV